MNFKGFQLAISTIVLLVIGVFLLIGFIYFLTGGFDNFRNATNPLIEGTAGSAVKQTCEIACDLDDKFTYCCNDFEIDGESLNCDDTRLEINCNLDCSGFSCQ